MLGRKLKPKKCQWCREDYVPWNSLQKTCNPECAFSLIKHKQESQLKRDIKAAEYVERKRIAVHKEALRSRTWYVKTAQSAFNAYIRERDAGLNCISCQKPPKKLQAGHYKTTAAYPELRFHPFNNNLQCFHCNVHLSGSIDTYRPNLVKKIGEANVLWLEGEQKLQNLTIDDLKDIRQHYKEQLRYLKKER